MCAPPLFDQTDHASAWVGDWPAVFVFDNRRDVHSQFHFIHPEDLTIQTATNIRSNLVQHSDKFIPLRPSLLKRLHHAVSYNRCGDLIQISVIMACFGFG